MALTALASACVPVYRPDRAPLDQAWNERMVTGRYGMWQGGEERPPGPRRDDRLASSPVDAVSTRYGIRVSSDPGPFANAKWYQEGGLLGRAEVGDRTVELFGKQTALMHLPGGTSKAGRDYSYDFFLLTRPRGGGRARVVRSWQFGPEDVALVVDTRFEDALRRAAKSDAEFERLRAQQAHERVEASLAYDSSSRIATVTISGLKQAFEQRVDLSQAIP